MPTHNRTQRTSPLRRAVALALLGGGFLVLGQINGDDLFYSLAISAFAILLIGWFWAWSGLRGLQISRWLSSHRTQVGHFLEERITLINRSPLPKYWLEIRDHSELPGHRASRVIPRVGARQRRIWTTRTFCRQRGLFRLGPITIISSDPFGLFTFQRHIAETDMVTIYPAIEPIPTFSPPIGHLPGGYTVRQRTATVTPNVAGVREYIPGDPFRRIHWPSTAHRGHLIVKEFEFDPTSDIWILLDMQATAHAGTIPPSWKREISLTDLLRPKAHLLQLPPTTEEYAIAAAAALSHHFLIGGRAVGLIAHGPQREVIPSDRGPRQLNRILETLAILRAQGQPSLAEILIAEGIRLGQGITTVLITPSADPLWTTAVRDLVRRGIQPIVVLIDAASFGAEVSYQAVTEILAAYHIPTYRIQKEEKLSTALSAPLIHPRNIPYEKLSGQRIHPTAQK